MCYLVSQFYYIISVETIWYRHFFSSSIELVEEEISLTIMHNLKILGTGAFLFPQLR